MNIGVSTACLYPLETEKSLQTLAQAGFKDTEIFFNASYEMYGFIFDQIKEILDNYNMNVTSIHPFTSFAESFLLFNAYRRRFYDGLEFYKKYFDTANRLNCDIVVIHGCKLQYAIEEDDYIERFAKLYELGREFGVKIAQENVVNFMSGSLLFLENMKKQLGNDFKMVFDIKQAVRSGYNPLDLVDKLGDSFVHLHLSDHDLDKGKDCLPPGLGNFDFKTFFDKLKEKNYQGNSVIELYRHNFDKPQELYESKLLLEKI
ncbi:MAG: sugar phosphate isomerase/epimerase [Clostridiales bacterium]|nr:sugar phosphate isomerase/epimerase [Clostridiales bacterium]